MALIRWTPRDTWDPFANLTDIQQEMNRLFESSLRRRVGGSGTLGSGFVPAIDVVEEKDKLVVRCDLPGYSKDDVSVTLEDNCLSIKGERKPEAVSKEANYYRQERVYGSFHRVFELPMSVNAQSIEAHFRDGVLQVTLPKAEEAKPKQIPVKVN